MVKHTMCCNVKETTQFKPKYINLSSYINQSNSKKRDRIVKSAMRNVIHKIDDKKLFSIFQSSKDLLTQFCKRNQKNIKRFLRSQLSDANTVNTLKNTLVPFEFINELSIKEDCINKKRLITATLYQSVVYFKENKIALPFACENICSWRIFKNVYDCKIICIDTGLKVIFSDKGNRWEKTFSSIVDIEYNTSFFRNVSGLVIRYEELINMKHIHAMIKMYTKLPIELCSLIYDYALPKHIRPIYVL